MPPRGQSDNLDPFVSELFKYDRLRLQRHERIGLRRNQPGPLTPAGQVGRKSDTLFLLALSHDLPDEPAFGFLRINSSISKQSCYYPTDNLGDSPRLASLDCMLLLQEPN